MTSGLRDRLPLFQSTVRIVRAQSATPIPGAKSAADRYTCGEELAKGGMGRVDRGTDRFLNRAVALKRSLTSEPHMLEILLREAEIAARLEHPSIVTIHDVAHDENNQPFVVMRLVDGLRLSEIVAKTTDLAARLRLLPRVMPAIEAAAFAHRRGIVHRDLKPDNILLGEFGDTVVIDWGLALDLEGGEDPFAGSSAGTVGFMSPEQERGDPVDARTDVFALGMTLYHVLTGRAPEPELDLGATIIDREPGVPRELVTILDKATARELGARYANAGELAAELQRFIGGQLVAAHHYSLGVRVARWLRRHRAAVSISVLAFVVLAIGAIVALQNVVAAKADAESGRRDAVTRTDQLIEDRALAVVGEDPARALALLDLRSRDEQTPAAWATAVEATARGIPVMWKEHVGPVVRTLVLGDGVVVTAGRDGRLVMRDGTGQRRELAKYAGSLQMVAVTDGFVVAGPGVIERFDRTGKALARWPTDDPIDLFGGGNFVVWRHDNELFVRNLVDGTVMPMPVFARSLDVDPTGTWCALFDGEHVRIVELATREVRIDEPFRGAVSVWSFDGKHLLAADPTGLTEWNPVDGSHRRWPSQPSTAGYLGDQPVAIGLGGCLSMLASDNRPPFVCFANTMRGATSSRDLVVIGPDGHDVRIFSPHRNRTAILDTRVAGAPKASSRPALGPRGDELTVSTDDGELAYWDLRKRAASVEPIVATAGDLGDGHLYLVIDGELGELVGSRWQPIATLDGKTQHLASVISITPTGAVIVLDHALRRLRGTTTEVIVDGVVDATEVDAGHALITDPANRVLLVDLATKQSTVLVTGGTPPAALAGDGKVVAAAWSDGRVWWRDALGQTHDSNAGCKVTVLEVSDPDVEVACDDQLRSMINGPRLLAKIDSPIHSWTIRSGPRAIITMRSALWRIGDGQVTQLVPPGNDPLPAIADDRFATVDRLSGAVSVHDLRTGHHAQVGTIVGPVSIHLTKDGRELFVRGNATVLRWRDPTPIDPAAWPAWKASVTPATLRDPSATLDWR